MLKYEASAGLVLPYAELETELQVRQRTLQFLSHGVDVGLLVIPVIEANEWPAHGACHEHQRLLSFEELERCQI